MLVGRSCEREAGAAQAIMRRSFGAAAFHFIFFIYINHGNQFVLKYSLFFFEKRAGFII